MTTDQGKQKNKVNATETKKENRNSVNPEEDFHIESGEKKNALRNSDNEHLMGMDSPDDAEELGNDRKS